MMIIWKYLFLLCVLKLTSLASARRRDDDRTSNIGFYHSEDGIGAEILKNSLGNKAKGLRSRSSSDLVERPDPDNSRELMMFRPPFLKVLKRPLIPAVPWQG